MGNPIESWGPSLMIAASTVLAFVAGRVLAWAARRTRLVGAVRISILVISILAAVYFLITPSSRYALLLPAAFALGHFSYGHARLAPRVFDK